ncbi:HNH endonuclease [Bacillus inaquosorum]|uniref:HNH endonuclease n=1 Tax=Bacillus inaquosorum TaxID=483913 RepID=UPI00227EB394|nr:HNH endonuclease [Bacillus inaquosorum]MCY7961516.1 HNH endonuclease [Bacillus inaquosorum]
METKTISDYRNTSYKQFDFTINDKKIKFIKDFKLDYPKAWKIYDYINKKGQLFNLKFRAIYHDKCAYCGISTQVINASNFEVDHFIPKSVLESELRFDKRDIHGINNLVNSCQMCNRGKLDFLCDIENLETLHPDNNRLPLIFNRKSDFSIVINKEYENNNIIKDFYNKLKLNNQLRRLDYLLMEMKDFCERHEGAPIINEIQKLILKIESKRRRNY